MLSAATPDLRAAREIIKDRLYFLVVKKGVVPKNTAKQIFFTVDHVLLYQPFFGDFGPLNLGCTYRFCQMVKEKLENPKNEGKTIYYYCSSVPQQKSNAAVLIGAYQVIHMDRHPDVAYKPLEAYEPYMPFRDAAQDTPTFPLTVKHCLRAFWKAQQYKFFDFNTFNIEEYEHYESVENGDLNLLIPNKFLAFAGPQASRVGPDGLPAHTPDDYAPIFKKYGVSTVIRLNKKCYDRKRFTDHGFAHYDLYFVDGTTPPAAILDRFLQICESHKGTIAVHCKAGLGRTGTTIGCYIMKHWRLTAAEVIAWLRICRPGCIIGPQQHFLRQQQARLWKEGRKFRMSPEEEEFIRPNNGGPIVEDRPKSSRETSLSGMVKDKLHMREERKEFEDLAPDAPADATAPLPQASPHSPSMPGSAYPPSSTSSSLGQTYSLPTTSASLSPSSVYTHVTSSRPLSQHNPTFRMPHSPAAPLRSSILYAGGVHLDRRITYPARASPSGSEREALTRQTGLVGRVYREAKDTKEHKWRHLPAPVPTQRITRSMAQREAKANASIPSVDTRPAVPTRSKTSGSVRAVGLSQTLGGRQSLGSAGLSRGTTTTAAPAGYTRQQQMKIARLSKEQ